MNYRHINAFCKETIPDILKSSDGKRVFQDTASFVETDRWNNFDLFHKTHSNIAAKYSESGLQSGLYTMATGSDIGTGRWIIPHCEDVEAATLDIISPKRKRITDYKQCPWSVIQWTASTPKNGLTGTVVVVTEDDIQNLKRRKLRGCFALLDNFNRSWITQLAKAGVTGIIIDREIPNNPDARQWTKFGWGGLGMAYSSIHLPGMVISSNQGAEIRKLIANGQEVKALMKISARHYSGTHEMAWGLLEGQADPQQEIWGISHSAEPGAIDNASGVATCLEALRILQILVTSGKIEAPKRSIRMLSGFECYSFFNYLENERRFQAPLAGACIDSVGSKPEVCKGRIEWHRTIAMSAGFVNRIGRQIISKTLKLTGNPYKLVDAPFVSTLDTLIGDPKYGFPCPWMTTHYQSTGRGFDAYHSSADTMDLLSKKGLQACAVSLAAYVYYLANAGEKDMFEMMKNETAASIIELKKIAAKKSAIPKAQSCDYVRQAHHTSLERLRRFAFGSSSSEVSTAINRMESEVAQAAKIIVKPAKKASVATKHRAVPVRKIPVTPTIENTPVKFAESINNCGLHNWALFWADSNRNIDQITKMISCEYGRKIEAEKVYEFFTAHNELGYVKLTPPENIIRPASITADLKKLGVKAGMNLIVHSSLSAVGFVEGGADGVIDALIKAVGKSGTVMVPTFNHMQAQTFNPATTPGLNGSIAEALWKRENSFRSDHTTHSVAAIGRMAEHFCKDHTVSGLWTANSPLGKLMAANGYVLCLGVDQIYSTHYHLAEVELGNCIDPKGSVGKLVSHDGIIVNVPTLAYRGGECPSHPGEIGKLMDKSKLRKKGFVGQAESTLAKAADIFNLRVKMLKKHCKNCCIKPKVTGI